MPDPSPSVRTTRLRRDHVAGGALILIGASILALSRDLPFGTLASPGAGMLPMLIVATMMAFAAILLLGAGDSPPFAGIAWGDLPHAARVVAAAAAAVALYETLGFILTMALLLFSLTWLVERRPLLPALALSLGVTALTCALFSTLLKTPLPRGLVGF